MALAATVAVRARRAMIPVGAVVALITGLAARTGAAQILVVVLITVTTIKERYGTKKRKKWSQSLSELRLV